MMQLLEKPEKFRILHLEDDSTSQVTLDLILSSTFKNIRLKQIEAGLKYYCFAPFENPDLIICDWILADGDVTPMLEELSKFKGLVIFLSSLSRNDIKTAILDTLQYMPNNFSIYTKGSKKGNKRLIKEINNYAMSINKNVTGDYCSHSNELHLS